MSSKTTKVAIIAFCVIVLTLSFVSCSGVYYRIKVDDSEKIIISIPKWAKAGDTVEIKISLVYDAIVEVFADGERIDTKYSNIDAGDGDRYEYYIYFFTMPSHSVKISVKILNGFLDSDE